MKDPTLILVPLTRKGADAAFSAAALLGVSQEEVMNMGVQLLAQFIAGREGQIMVVELGDDLKRTVHFH